MKPKKLRKMRSTIINMMRDLCNHEATLGDSVKGVFSIFEEIEEELT